MTEFASGGKIRRQYHRHENAMPGSACNKIPQSYLGNMAAAQRCEQWTFVGAL
jgi:hypothetical protein